jgi:hypothetical protein
MSMALVSTRSASINARIDFGKSRAAMRETGSIMARDRLRIADAGACNFDPTRSRGWKFCQAAFHSLIEQ